MGWTEPRTWIPGETPGATELNQHVRDNLRALLPLASLVLIVAPRTAVETVLENRFLECNGVAVSRATYASLFNYFNAQSPALPFGIGNGSTTFNLPDLSGRAPWALGTHASVDTMGKSDGEVLGTRSPRHYHGTAWDTAGGSGVVWARGAAATGEGLLGDGSGPRDEVAFQVIGVWYIKYTS